MTVPNASAVPTPEILDEVDIQEYAKQGLPIPLARVYKIVIDREARPVNVPSMTGRQILALVNMTPETHKLYEVTKGQQPRRIQPDEKVDFTRPGVERFQTIPLDPQEG